MKYSEQRTQKKVATAAKPAVWPEPSSQHTSRTQPSLWGCPAGRYLLAAYSCATPLAGQPQQNHDCSLLWPNKDHTAQKMLCALTKTSLKYASFAAQRSCSRPLILRAKEGTNRVDILPFSHPSDPLTHKHALGKLPQLHLLPLERQKNSGTAVPAHIRMQTSSVRPAAVPHLKAPRYSLISLQLRKE